MEKKSADYPEVPVSVLRKLKKGDKKAFDEVYHAYKARIYGNLFRLVKSEDIARDLLQEVFVRLWEKRELLDPEQPVHSWMFRVATNLAMDFFRKASRDRTLEKQIITIAAGNDAYNHVEEQLFGKELNMMLNQAIEQLSPGEERSSNSSN